MSKAILYPSLSSHSWTDSPVVTGDMLMSDFLVAEYSQTYIYASKVSSLPYILQNTAGDVNQTASEIQQTLTTYFSRYFSNVIVECRAIDNTTNSGKESISLYLQYTDSENKTHTLNKLMTYANTKFMSIVNQTNL